MTYPGRRGDPQAAAVARLERATAPAHARDRSLGVGVTAAVSDRLPVGLRAALVSPGGRGLAGLSLLVAAAVAVGGAGSWLARPHEVSAGPAADARPVGRPLDAATSPPSPSAAASVVVHVAGAVRRPGLVQLPPGSRVADALDAAGGATRRADPASVNLARPLVDGEQIVLARRGGAPAAAQAGGTPAGTPAVAPGAAPADAATPVDLNVATLEQLDALPGIGPVLAQRILDWRAANGRFSSVDELGEVSGIGEATLADLRPLVRV